MRPLLFSLDAELVHSFGMVALKLGLFPVNSNPVDPCISSKVWGLEFPRPLGMAAGFDKNAEVFEKLFDLGFGFVETGTVTPQPQFGNEKPRIFRLEQDLGIINRLGFNNRGIVAYAKKISNWSNKANKAGVLGVNIGTNKDTKNRISDFVRGATELLENADYMVVNVSSPNTPGLRDMQSEKELKHLILAVMDVRDKSKKFTPLLIKIAPDLSDLDKKQISDVALDTGIDGIIVSNTTIKRSGELISKNKTEIGGLSGEPLFLESTKLLKEIFRLTHGRIPLIGVGGVSNGEQAYSKIKAGASLIQIYSAFIYKGPSVVANICNELSQLIKDDGFKNITDAIGIESTK